MFSFFEDRIACNKINSLTQIGPTFGSDIRLETLSYKSAIAYIYQCIITLYNHCLSSGTLKLYPHASSVSVDFFLTIHLVFPPGFEPWVPNAIQPLQEQADAESQEQSNYHVHLLPGHDVTHSVVSSGIHRGLGPIIWHDMIDLMPAADRAVASGYWEICTQKSKNKNEPMMLKDYKYFLAETKIRYLPAPVVQ